MPVTNVVTITQDLSANQLATVLMKYVGRRITLFTDDGNEITGRIATAHKGYIRLRHATVTKNGVVLLNRVSLRVAISKIDSFSIQHHHHHHHCM